MREVDCGVRRELILCGSVEIKQMALLVSLLCGSRRIACAYFTNRWAAKIRRVGEEVGANCHFVRGLTCIWAGCDLTVGAKDREGPRDVRRRHGGRWRGRIHGVGAPARPGMVSVDPCGRCGSGGVVVAVQVDEVGIVGEAVMRGAHVGRVVRRPTTMAAAVAVLVRCGRCGQ